MEGETRQILEDELVKLTAKFGQMNPESQEFRETAKAISELGSKINESWKNEYDYDQRTCASEREIAFRKEELESKNELAKQELEFKNRELDAKIAEDKAKRRSNVGVELLKGAIEGLAIVLPLKVYTKVLQQDYLYQAKGVMPGSVSKHLFNFIKIKKR